MEEGTSPASRLLRSWGHGDLQARDALVPVVYGELRRRAGAYLRRERPDHTLQPTALVHEANVRLMGQERVAWQNRAHFFAMAAQMMRQVLTDHAREHPAAKRPDAAVRVVLDDRVGAIQPRDCELMALDQALVELARIDPQQVRSWSSATLAGCRSRRSRPSCRFPARPSRVNGTHRAGVALSTDDDRTHAGTS